MTDEARQRIDELQKERRGALWRNSLLIFTSTATVLLALVLFTVLRQQDQEINVYVEEAQKTVKVACEAAEGQPLPADVRASCEAAKRNELPSAIQSVVDNPDPDDPEQQESEDQEPENQEPEIQDPENQETEIPDTETDDPENDNPELDDPELQEEELQEGEIQDPEIQEPEEQGAPVCRAGWTEMEFHWYGRDGVDNTGDEQDWLICVKDS